MKCMKLLTGGQTEKAMIFTSNEPIETQLEKFCLNKFVPELKAHMDCWLSLKDHRKLIWRLNTNGTTTSFKNVRRKKTILLYINTVLTWTSEHADVFTFIKDYVKSEGTAQAIERLLNSLDFEYEPDVRHLEIPCNNNRTQSRNFRANITTKFRLNEFVRVGWTAN